MARSRVKQNIYFIFNNIILTMLYICYEHHLPETCNSYIDEAIQEFNYSLSHVVQTLVQIVQANEFAIPDLR
jgi:hypothetical protein